MEVGTTLFYHLSAYVSEDTKIYPPTRQFFSSCIEILGQVSRGRATCATSCDSDPIGHV